MGDQMSNGTHYPAGSSHPPRPTTIIMSKDNELKKMKVDGEVKSLPQPT